MLLTGILTVLKIIGIVLLVILAVVLLLLLLVLFAPVRYRIDEKVPKTDLDKGFDVETIDAAVKFSWLLFVIRGGIEFPKNKEFTLKVFGIKLLPKKEKPEKPGKEKKKKQDEKKEESTSEAQSQGVIEESSGFDEQESGESSSTEVSATVSEGEATTEEAVEEEPKSFLDVLWNIFDTIDRILKTPLDVLEKIQYTISRVCGKIDMVKTTLESEIFKRAFDLVKRKLIKIIKMILPDKCKIDILLGTGDPAQTAEIMGVYGALYPIFYKKVNFEPSFEEKTVMADVHMKGHITLFTIVYSAAVCYFNKDVKKVIKRFKKIMST